MSLRNLVIKYLSPSLGEIKYTSQGVKINCPYCDDGNKYNLEVCLIKHSKRYLVFHCWSCHYKGHLTKLFRDHAKSENWKTISELWTSSTFSDEKETTVIKELPKTIPYYLSTEANEYLKNNRGIHDLILLERKVLYCYQESDPLYDNLIFPYYENGILIGYTTQNLSTLKYKNHRDLNFVPYKEFINTNYPIIVTEGIFDAFSVPNAVPMLGTKPSEALLKFCESKKIILALDSDVPLETKKEIANKFYFYGAKSVAILDLMSFKDLNDWRVKDKLGLKEEMKNIFKWMLTSDV